MPETPQTPSRICRFPRTCRITTTRRRSSPGSSGVVIHLELLQSEAVQDLPISYRDFVVLATLRKEPASHALAVSQIARYTLRPMGSISQGLDRLERAGYVSRSASPEDRRKVIVALTPEGTRFADRALAAYDATHQRVFGRLDDDDLQRIDTAVTDLLAALDADYLDAHITADGPKPADTKERTP